MCAKYEVGADVLVSGYRSNSNPRRRASGVVTGVRSVGGRHSYDVEAGVQDCGRVIIRGLSVADLRCGA